MLIGFSYRNQESFSEDVYINGTKEQSINERYKLLISNIIPPETQKGTERTIHGTELQNLTK
jgi:hypothetical protein